MIISKTPLRVSLFGGGTDFPQWYENHGGAVLTTAIDKYIYVIVKRRFDDKIVLHYTKTEVCNSVDEIKHDYIREAMKHMWYDFRGIEVTTLADIPSEGTGLGSSSSLAVGLLTAFAKYQNHKKYNNPQEIAESACRLEIEILKKPIGVQDQYIAAYGGFHYISFDDRGVYVQDIMKSKTIQKLEERLLLFYTGIARQSSEILTEQIDNLEYKTEILKEMWQSARVGRGCIENGNIGVIANLFNSNWEMKKSLASTISNTEIDAMYKKALDAGATGGKICGAGGGGFMLLYVEPKRQDYVRKALSNYQELPFKFEAEGSKIVYQE